MSMDVRLASIAILFLIIGAVLGYVVAPKGGTTTVTVTVTKGGEAVTVTKTVTEAVEKAKAAGLSGEIPIGLAIAVSGGYAVDGPRRLKGALLAIEEMNSLLEKVGAPFRFKPIHEDTGGKPEQAVSVIQRFASLGVKVVVGPLSTAETKAVMPIANEKHIVIISPSSTGAAAAVPNDYVFRMPPPDTAQGRALARVIYSMGYTKIAVIARDDDYGRGLAELFEQEFKKLGGQVEKIMYQPDQPDYSNEVNQLSALVQRLGADEKTAVLIIAFDTDGRNILEHASKDPILAKVRWFGPDSMKRKTFLPPDAPESIAKFLVKVKFIGLFPAIARNPITEHFEKAYKEKYGENPTPYAYYAYDAAWIAMLSILVAGKYDGQAVKEVLPVVAAHYIGATGHKMLDKNGDAAFADYEIWTIVGASGKYEFKTVGIWHSSTGSIEWYQKS